MDYREILRDEYARRHVANPSYSQRAFARDLKISQGRLSEILAQKQGLSPERASAIAARLGLNQEERAFFRDAVSAEHGRSNLERTSAKARLKSHHLEKQRVKLLEDSFRLIADWYHLGILELTRLKNFKYDAKWIAKALDISEIQAKFALERLERMHLIKSSKTGVEVEMNFGGTTPSESVRTFHRQVLQKALAAIDLQSVERREVNSVLIAIKSEKLPVLKKKMQQVVRDFADESMQGADSLYCYSQQLFQIDSEI